MPPYNNGNIKALTAATPDVNVQEDIIGEKAQH